MVGSLKSLEKQLAILEGLVSPLRPERTLEEIRKNFDHSVKRTLEDDFNDPTAEQSRISVTIDNILIYFFLNWHKKINQSL